MIKIILPLLLFLSSCNSKEVYKPIIAQQQDNVQCVKFEHPTKAFTLNVPASWGKPHKFKYNPNVFSFYPSETAEFTVSISQNLNLSAELPASVAKMMFPEETPFTELKRNSGEGWNSIRQDYKGTKKGKSWAWLAVFYGTGSNAIAITLSDSAESINSHKELFERTVDSIAFNTKIYNK